MLARTTCSIAVLAVVAAFGTKVGAQSTTLSGGWVGGSLIDAYCRAFAPNDTSNDGADRSYCMSLFPWSLSAKERQEALALIGHLQTMFAYQQLSMEVYNDAVSGSAGTGTPINEGGFVRSTASLTNPTTVRAYVIPAMNRKLEILESMLATHANWQRPAKSALRQAYDDFTAVIHLARQRGQLQLEGFTAWVGDPTRAVDVTRLDRPENSAITKAATSLNKLIKKTGISTNDWLEINKSAFNSVRDSVGQPPLTSDAFRETFHAGLAGRPARFFDK